MSVKKHNIKNRIISRHDCIIYHLKIRAENTTILGKSHNIMTEFKIDECQKQRRIDVY